MTTGEDLKRELEKMYVGQAQLLLVPYLYIAFEKKVNEKRRLLDRFRLEAFIRFDGEQMCLASAENLLFAYETLEQLSYRDDEKVEALRTAIEEGYKLPLDED